MGGPISDGSVSRNWLLPERARDGLDAVPPISGGQRRIDLSRVVLARIHGYCYGRGHVGAYREVKRPFRWRSILHRGWLSLLTTIGRLSTWTFLSILPVYGWFFIGSNLEGSRYLYLASCGWSIGVAALIFEPRRTGLVSERRNQGLRRDALRVALFAALLFMLANGSVRRIDAWRGAAGIRDTVIASATAVLADTHCGTVRLAHVPDSRRGRLRLSQRAARCNLGANGSHHYSAPDSSPGWLLLRLDHRLVRSLRRIDEGRRS